MKDKLSEDEKNLQANEKRRKHKAAKDRLLATKTKEGGLLLVHTGKGKGKTTAAMGMVCRCVGLGKKVGIVQFVKGKWEKLRFKTHSVLITISSIHFAII